MRNMVSNLSKRYTAPVRREIPSLRTKQIPKGKKFLSWCTSIELKFLVYNKIMEEKTLIQTPWFFSVEEVLNKLDTSTTGLSEKEAQK